jgi:hypothetical protein
MTTTLITGANKGLGKETARMLVAAGHTVWLGARDAPRGRAAAEELGARFVQLDVTHDASVAAALAHDPHGVMGTRVRVGNFATQAQAQTEASALTAAGFSPLVEWTGFDAQPAPDAELLHVAIVDPHQFAGQVIADHGSAIASRQTVPAASAALGSLAATNGGFFTIDTQLAAVNGVNTGVSAYHGQLESLADGDRAALLLDAHQPAGIENLTTTATVSAGQRSTRILGLNRGCWPAADTRVMRAVRSVGHDAKPDALRPSWLPLAVWMDDADDQG